MRDINGKSILQVAKDFEAIAKNSFGHVLLWGMTGSGKSTVLEYFLSKNNATSLNFETKEPIQGDLSESRFFDKELICVIDHIDFFNSSNKFIDPLIEFLKVKNTYGRRLIISTQMNPSPLIRDCFRDILKLEKNLPGDGVDLVLDSPSLASVA